MSTAEKGGVVSGVASPSVAARIERLPRARWQVKARLVIGVATFFDAFDALTVAYVMPVLAPMWGLSPTQIALAISIGFFGQLVGALLVGFVAERFGRIPTAAVSVLIFGLASLALAFSPNYTFFLVVRLIQGIGLGAEVPVAATYIAEITKAHNRGKFVLLYELVFPVGLMCAAIAGFWIVPNLGWQWMFVIGALPALIAVYLRRGLPESPRWLEQVGRNADADRVMTQLEVLTVEQTGEPLPDPVLAVTIPVRKARLADLFGGRYLRRTIVVWIVWFTAYLTTYGLTSWLPTIYLNVYKVPLSTALLYSLITTGAGLVGAAVCAFTVDRIGRRGALGSGLVVGGALLLVLWALGAGSAPQVLLWSALAYGFVNAVALGVYLYTPELYPTRVRALGVGVASGWLRLASIVGPFIVSAILTGGANIAVIFLIFGAVAILGGVVMAVLGVETKEKVLEEFSP